MRVEGNLRASLCLCRAACALNDMGVEGVLVGALAAATGAVVQHVHGGSLLLLGALLSCRACGGLRLPYGAALCCRASSSSLLCCSLTGRGRLLLLLLRPLWGRRAPEGHEAGVLLAVESLHICLVLAEENLGLAVKPDVVLAERGVLREDVAIADHLQARPLAPLAAPRPSVTEEGLGQQVQLRLLGPAVDRSHGEQNVVHRRAGILHVDVKVPVLIKDARVHELVLGIVTAERGVFVAQGVVRELCLRVLVQHLQVAVARRCVQVVVQVLDVLAVIALRAPEPKQPLLENGVLPIPHGQGQAEPLLAVAEPGDAVLAPPIRDPVGVLEGHVHPGVAARAVVLPARAPLALAHVRPPPLPVLHAQLAGLEPLVLGGAAPLRLGVQQAPTAEAKHVRCRLHPAL
mmetsp:Transcript_11102/g.33456  ORF Transcript_11102/g.33456 Transcript_11102/m.33456 type:complete len:404 (+) Transcript_11102:619-1830(+)